MLNKHNLEGGYLGHPFFMANIGIIGAGWLIKKWMEKRPEENFIVTTRTGISPAPLSCIKQTYAFEISSTPLVFDQWQDVHCIICSIPFSSRATVVENEHKANTIIQQIKDWKKPTILLSSTAAYPLEKRLYTEDDATESNSVTIVEDRFKSLSQVIILRLGGLMGGERYLSKYISNPTSTVVNHIHYEDAYRAIEHVLKNDLWNNTFNVVAPQHPTQEEIVHFQKTNTRLEEKREFENRIVLGDRLCATGFDYIHSDPILFK